MKLKEVSPNNIYRVSASHNTLIFIWNNMKENNNHTITYEIIAMSKETEATLFLSEGFDHKVFQVSEMDLPLYIHLPIKSLNFDRLLKGEPLEKIESPAVFSQWDISQFLKNSSYRKYHVVR